MGLLKNPSWRALVERYIASTIAPLADFPAAYTVWAHDALIELRVAVRAEDERRSKEREKSTSSGPRGLPGPVWPDQTRSAGSR
jgi:hypothetical protein